MNLLDFQAAMAPHLKEQVHAFYFSRLTFSEQKDLKENYRKRVMTAYCLSQSVEPILPRLQALDDRVFFTDPLFEGLVTVFFMTIEKYEAIDNGTILSLKISSYEARLRNFLNKLAEVLSDYQLETDRKTRKRASKNGKITASPPKYVIEIVVNGQAICI